MSKGEEKIAKILADANLTFEQEKTYSDCGRGKYRFDFYVPRLQILIEYQGEQHYQRTSIFFKDSHEFMASQARDRKKISYCLAHKIPLYLIPFWELQNINTIQDLLNDKFIAHRRGDNDDRYREYQAKHS